MIKKEIAILVFTVALFQSSCLLRKPNPAKLWFYTYSSIVGGDEMIMTPSGFLDLEPDGSYYKDFGKYDYGDWQIRESELLLTSRIANASEFPIKKLFGNELQLITRDGMVVNFESQRGAFSTPLLNPFSSENNRWRIPAVKKETERQIKDRLVNHFRFFEVYFRWALDYDLSEVDAASTPSLIRIYGNGFALKSFGDLPKIWCSYFFDEEDCRRASDIIKNIFEHKDIAWVNTKSRYKMFISAFQQMQQILKQV